MGIFNRKPAVATVEPTPTDPAHVSEEQRIVDELVRCATFSHHQMVGSSVYDFPSYGARFECKNYDTADNRAYWYSPEGADVQRNNFVELADSSMPKARRLDSALKVIVSDVTGRSGVVLPDEKFLVAAERILVNLHFATIDTSKISYESFPHAEVWKNTTSIGNWQITYKKDTKEFYHVCKGEKFTFETLAEFSSSVFSQSFFHALQHNKIYTHRLQDFLAASFENALIAAKGGKVSLVAPSIQPMSDIEKITAERDQLLIERDELLSERDDLLNELDSYRTAS